MTTKAFRAGKRAPNTVFELSDVSALAGLSGDYDGQQVSLAGWHPDSTVGGGTLVWNPNRAKSDHNGGTVFSPTVPWTTTTADYLNGVGETDPAGLGVWESLTVVVDFESFGAKGDGVTDDSESIRKCVNSGFKVINKRKAEYAFAGSYIDVSVALLDIDFNGSTIMRTGGVGTIFATTSASFNLKNGTINLQNNSSNFSHTINFNNPNGDYIEENMIYKNNLLGGEISPVVSQDIDHVYVDRAKKYTAINCSYENASRQGISLVGAIDTVIIRYCVFESCYLFGVDIEPNTSTADMYNSVEISKNKFIDCGPKSEAVFVWNSGGPLGVASGDQSVMIVNNISITENEFISKSFLNVSPTRVEPFIKIEQFRNLLLAKNIYTNLDRILIASNALATEVESVRIYGDEYKKISTGNMQGNIFCYESDKLDVVGGFYRNLSASAKSTLSISANFYDSPIGIKVQKSTPCKKIENCTFDNVTNCIDTSADSVNYSIIGNKSCGDTLFITNAITQSVATGNSYDGGSNAPDQIFERITTGVSSSYSSTNGVIFNMTRNDTTTTIEDVFCEFNVYSNDSDESGLIGTYRAVKDVTNASPYTGWEWFTGSPTTYKSRLHLQFNGDLIPSRDITQDNIQNLGSPSIRWSTVYAGTGTINTSDKNLKTEIIDISSAELATAKEIKGKIKRYKFLDAVERKGDGARNHFGVIAQDVEDCFKSNGLNPNDYALFCKDTYYTIGDKVVIGDDIPLEAKKNERLGIRYDELICFIISTM